MAIIGVVFQLIPAVLWSLVNLGLLVWFESETGIQYWYFRYLQIVSFLGLALLLPFLITLYKNQK